jgi:hypothetical protein
MSELGVDARLTGASTPYAAVAGKHFSTRQLTHGDAWSGSGAGLRRGASC